MSKFFRHKLDRDGSCSEMGENAETLFSKAAKKNGYDVLKANKKLEFDKVDFVLTKGEKKIKVEVKARKRISRKDKVAQDELLWVEISNVSAKEGNNGWLYGGADVIAFEQEDKFVIVNRESLVSYVEKNCDLTNFVKNSKDALYKSYRRRDRPAEHLTIVDFSKMLKNVLHVSWNKHDDRELPAGFYIECREQKNGPWHFFSRTPYGSFDEAVTKMREIEAGYVETLIRKK